MRPNRSLAVLLASLALGGCAQHAPQYQYVAVPGPIYQTPIQPVMQAPRQQPSVMQVARSPASQPSAVPPYQRPVAQAPACPPQGCQPPVPQRAAVQAPIAQVAAAPARQAFAYQAPSGFDVPYTLDSGDRLRISVFGQDGLTNSYAVDAAGNITMPLIGSVPARGLTPPQLSKSISERLRQGYIREPHVTLEIEAYRPFFILGEVTTPGQYAYVANMTAETAVAIAGGFGPRADKSQVSISRNLGGQLTQGMVPLTYPLRPGDTVRIPERWF
jgi:polysaccharide export outer membrane protein